MVPARTVLEAIGEAVARERNRRSLTQVQLAQQCGLDRYTVMKIEHGRPTVAASLMTVIEHLNLSMDSLMGRECGHEYFCRKCGQEMRGQR